MANEGTNVKVRNIHHRGRITQIPIYFGKLVRQFIYQNDWIVLPMSAVIAGMVAMVIRKGFAVDMEGTLKGAFALTCVGIWNGCFNSIQAICRERNVVKREHRSGMHITSYMAAHMLYQFILCFMQTILMMVICMRIGVNLSGKGLITDYMLLDVGISLMIITYAADMMALLISAFVHNTTAAMTLMPFILIFQLIFSGGIFVLPGFAGHVSNYTISRYGMDCIAAQAHYNELPMERAWTMVSGLKDNVVVEDMTVGDFIDAAGEERLKDIVVHEASKASKREDFDSTKENVIDCWMAMILFTIVFAASAIILLEFIDKDKR